jgi:hypothetical protein
MRTTLLVLACMSVLAILCFMGWKMEKFSPRDGDAALVCYWAPPPPPMTLAKSQDPSGLVMSSRTSYSSISTSTPKPDENVTTVTTNPRRMPVSTRIQQTLNANRRADIEGNTIAPISPGMQNTMVAPLPLPPVVPLPTQNPTSPGIVNTPPPPTTTPPAFVPAPLALT